MELNEIEKMFGGTSKAAPTKQQRQDSPDDFAEYAMDDLVNKRGLSVHQAAGIVGNLLYESIGGKVDAVNPTSGAYGYAQWLGPRKKELFRRYGERPTRQQQMDFLWDELNTTHRGALDAVANAVTVMDSTKAFHDLFEKSDKPAYETRYQEALKAIKRHRERGPASLSAGQSPESSGPMDLDGINAMFGKPGEPSLTPQAPPAPPPEPEQVHFDMAPAVQAMFPTAPPGLQQAIPGIGADVLGQEPRMVERGRPAIPPGTGEMIQRNLPEVGADVTGGVAGPSPGRPVVPPITDIANLLQTSGPSGMEMGQSLDSSPPAQFAPGGHTPSAERLSNTQKYIQQIQEIGGQIENVPLQDRVKHGEALGGMAGMNRYRDAEAAAHRERIKPRSGLGYRIADFPADMATSLISGTSGTLSGGFKALNWLAGQVSQAFGVEVQPGYDHLPGFSRAALALDKAAQLSQPYYSNFFTDVAQGLGSSMAFLVPGIGVAGWASHVARVAPWLSRIMGISVPAVMESLVEGQEARETVYQKTGSIQEADKAAWTAALINGPVIALTDRLGIFGEYAKLSRRVIASSGANFAQEFVQSVTQDYATNSPQDWKKSGYAGLVGAPVGAVFGAATPRPIAPPDRIDQLVDSLFDRTEANRLKQIFVQAFHRNYGSNLFTQGDVFKYYQENPGFLVLSLARTPALQKALGDISKVHSEVVAKTMADNLKSVGDAVATDEQVQSQAAEEQAQTPPTQEEFFDLGTATAGPIPPTTPPPVARGTADSFPTYRTGPTPATATRRPLGAEGPKVAEGKGAQPQEAKTKEPWEMTQDEYLKSRGALKPDMERDDFANKHLNDVPIGVPGLSVEGNKVVYRDDNGYPIGVTSMFTRNGIKVVDDTGVRPANRRQGIATKIYRKAKELGYSEPYIGNKISGGIHHKIEVEDALTSGKLTPAQAEALGHFKDYPELGERFGAKPRTPIEKIKKRATEVKGAKQPQPQPSPDAKFRQKFGSAKREDVKDVIGKPAAKPAPKKRKSKAKTIDELLRAGDRGTLVIRAGGIDPNSYLVKRNLAPEERRAMVRYLRKPNPGRTGGIGPDDMLKIMKAQYPGVFDEFENDSDFLHALADGSINKTKGMWDIEEQAQEYYAKLEEEINERAKEQGVTPEDIARADEFSQTEEGAGEDYLRIEREAIRAVERGELEAEDLDDIFAVPEPKSPYAGMDRPQIINLIKRTFKGLSEPQIEALADNPEAYTRMAKSQHAEHERKRKLASQAEETKERPLLEGMGDKKKGLFESPRSPYSARPAPAFYSKLQQMVKSDKFPNQAPPAVMVGVLNSWASKGLIKAEELKWSGVIPWLQEQKGKVSRADVAGYVQGQRVEVRVVEKKGITEESLSEIDEAYKKLDSATRKKRELFQEAHNMLSVISDRPMDDLYIMYGYGGYEDEPNRSKLEDDAWKRASEAYPDYDWNQLYDADREVDNANWNLDIVQSTGQEVNTKFGSYMQPPPGGKNYQEFFGVAPYESKFEPTKVKIDRRQSSQTQGTTTIYYDGKKLQTYSDNPELQNNGKYAQRPDSYWINVAKKLYEQGDRTNRVKKIGDAYTVPASHQYGETEADANRLWHCFTDDRVDTDGNKVMFILEGQSDWARDRRSAAHDIATGQGLKPGTDEYQTKVSELVNSNEALKGVPTVPYLKDWHENMIKHMLRYAAENGYDKLAWATGEMVQKRYDLSKHIDILWYEKNKDGTYNLIGEKGEDTIIERDALTEKGVEELVGKDVTQRIVEGKGEPEPDNPGMKGLSGLDLKIGGEWAKALYDKMLPAFVNKYGKQWGVRSGSVDIPFVSPAPEHFLGGPDVNDSFTVHAIPITPNMRQDVLYKGQPLFQPMKKYQHTEATAAYGSETKAAEARREVVEAIRTRPVSRPGVQDISRRNWNSEVARVYQKQGYIDFRGYQLREGKETQDLADLFVVYRSPKAETLREIYTDKDGRILAHNASSSGKLSYVDPQNLAKYFYHIKRRSQKLGAAKVHILHNHPAGDPSMSHADVIMAGMSREALGGLAGEFVVIDHEKFAFVKDPDTLLSRMYADDLDSLDPANYYDTKTYAAPPQEAGSWLVNREEIRKPSDVMQAARGVQAEEGQVITLHINARGQVNGVTAHNPEIFDHPDVAGNLKAISKSFDSDRVAIVADRRIAPVLWKSLSDRHHKMGDWLIEFMDDAGQSYRLANPDRFLEPEFDYTKARQVFQPFGQYGKINDKPKDIVGRKDIVDFLRDTLGQPIRFGRFFGRRKARGLFFPKNEMIRTKFANDPATTAHEVFHAIHKYLFPDARTPKGGLSASAFTKKYGVTAAMRKELSQLAYPGANSKLVEGFAEFGRLYLTDAAAAENQAPEFFNYYNDLLDNRDAELKSILLEARRMYAQWRSQSPQERIRAQRSSGEPSKKSWLNWDSFYAAAVDELYPIRKVVGKIVKGEKIDYEVDPYILARMLPGTTGKGDTFLQYKTFDYKTHQWNGKGLAEILEPIKERLNDFQDYIVARRANELHLRGKETGIEKADAIAIEKLFRDEFSQVFDELLAYQDRVLQYLVDSGVVSNDAAIAMRKLNKDYVPFYRLIEDRELAGGGKKGLEVRNPIKKIKGSWLNIIDPLESIIKNTYEYIRIADRNGTLQSLVNLAEKREGAGEFVERIPAKMAMPAKVKLTEVLTSDEIKALEDQDIQDLDRIVPIFRQSMFAPKGNVITVFEKGKQSYFELSPELFRAIAGLDAVVINQTNAMLAFLDKVFALPTKILRAGATLSPDFIVRNPIRDQWSAAVFARYGYVPVYDLFKGFFHFFKADELYWKYKASGAEMATLVSTDREQIQKKLDDIISGKIKLSHRLIKNPLELLQLLSSSSEMGTRLGVAERAGQDLTTKEGMLRAGFAGRSSSLDFNRKGHVGKIINRYIAFWNPTIQGLDKMVRAIKNHPKSFLFRTLAFITIPSILLAMLNNDDDKYRKLPQWQRDLFWYIPVGPGVLIPKPFELGILFGSVFERLTNYVMDNLRGSKRDDAFDKILGSITRSIAPGVWPTAILPLKEARDNYSEFLDRNIVSEGEKRLPPPRQYDKHTSDTMRHIGRWMGNVPYIQDTMFASPKKLQHIFRGYTGGLGTTALQGVDSIARMLNPKAPPRPTAQWADIPGLRGFIARWPTMSAEPIQKFYDKYAEIEGIRLGATASIKNQDSELNRQLGYAASVGISAGKRGGLVNPLARTHEYLMATRKEINNIYNDKKMDSKQKRKMIDKLVIDAINTAEKSLSYYKDMMNPKGKK